MSRLARRSAFAAPLVVTATLGCKGDRPTSKPTDAEVATRPAVDAAPALPDAPAGAQIIQTPGGRCYPLPPKESDQLEVKCPAGGPTLFAAGYQRGDVTRFQDGPWPGFVAGLGDCTEEEPYHCPPEGSCNPPPPRHVACPDELLIRVAPGMAITTDDQHRCFWNQIQVACLPEAPAGVGHVDVRADGTCWYEPEVHCPPDIACNPPAPIQVRCPER